MCGVPQQRMGPGHLQVGTEADLTLRHVNGGGALGVPPVGRKLNIEVSDEVRSSGHIVDVTRDLV